ncbi:hypothetical protein D3C86_1329810 [compost metagenome]
MWSVARRFRDSSTDFRMCFLLMSKPCSLVSEPTFVARTISCRFFFSFIHFPMISSDCPPFPFTHQEYVSAVSMKLNPPSSNLFKMLKDSFSSKVHPKTFPPKLIGAISKSVFLIFTFFIINNLINSFLNTKSTKFFIQFNALSSQSRKTYISEALYLSLFIDFKRIDESLICEP